MDTSIAWGEVEDWVLWKNTWHGCSTVVTLFFLFSLKNGHATTYSNNSHPNQLFIRVILKCCDISIILLFQKSPLFQGYIKMKIRTLRSLITAVICEPSASLFITSSHCVVITSAGASARVRSATNTISGFRTQTFISVFDTTAWVTADSGRKHQRKTSVKGSKTIGYS